ncbi:hypothetical protein [Paraburkholderia sp. J63]|uniref:hypothetical protein n=1 Tax=Paraburkholderia sp. J63 TaxID=2805434 RepID=UPI002ABDB269|nr:hypothetical protein [Paraburkholderia sp. J63]
MDHHQTVFLAQALDTRSVRLASYDGVVREQNQGLELWQPDKRSLLGLAFQLPMGAA